MIIKKILSLAASIISLLILQFLFLTNSNSEDNNSKYYSNDNINKLLYDKKKWIRKKIEEIDSYYKKKERKFLTGDKFFLYGVELKLVKTNRNKNEVIVKDMYVIQI